jgi:Domain of unknown function (DUF1877)
VSMILTVNAVTPAEIEALLAEPDTLDDVLGADPARKLSLEKAWHGLHFLLTGSANAKTGPEAVLLSGGEPFGEDLGYGPARLLRPVAVHALSANLSAISDDQLWGRYDAIRMTAEGVYPCIWDEDEADLREEYLGYYHALKDIVGRASQANDGLVIVME